MAIRLKRRKLIELMTKGVASSLFLPSLYGLPASAQASANDRKVLFVYAEAGATTRFMDMRPAWLPAAAADNYSIYNPVYNRQPDNSEWEFSFTDSRLTEEQMSRVLKPLWRHRDKMMYLEGLSMVTTGFDMTGGSKGDEHAMGHIGCINGTAAAYSYDGVKSVPIGPSMDQRLNAFFKQSNPQHRSLNYRLNYDGGIFHEFLYYDPGNGDMQRAPVETNPATAFERLFGGVEITANPLDQRRGAIFQLLNGQYTSLANRLSGDDRLKLESHRALINQLETSMAGVGSCDSPVAPNNGNNLSQVDKQYWMIDSFARLVAEGFSCGLSRVASIGFAGIPPDAYGLPASTSIHHEYEHESDPRLFYTTYQENPQSDAAQKWLRAEEGMVKRNVWQMEQLAKIVDVFANTPDSTGSGSLLDSTLIVYVNEIAHGVHGHEHWPVITFGNFGNGVTPGRYVKYAHNQYQTWNRNYFNQYTGVPQTKLFISLCQLCGMEIDYLLQPSMPGSAAGGGSGQVDLSGPLPRLKL